MHAARLLRHWLEPVFSRYRLLLAFKVALAAGIAWWVAPLIPGDVGDYYYYAPFGAIVSMMPTLMGSVRSGAQTLLGLVLGIALAWSAIRAGVPGVLGVPLAVGVGVLLSGLRGLGPGRDYIPVAALFVLVIGGADAEDFALGYAVQVTVGITIGVLVNFAIVPPLYLRDAAAEISSLREAAAGLLHEIADALAQDNPPDHAPWQHRSVSLSDATAAAETILDDARESRRINPRSRWHNYNMGEDYEDLDALRQISWHLVDLGEALNGSRWAGASPADLPEGLLASLSEAVRGVAHAVEAWEARSGEELAAESAEGALHALTAEFDSYERGGPQPRESLGAAIFDLRRVLALVKSRLRGR